MPGPAGSPDISPPSPWCQNHRREPFSFEAYLELTESFHGHAAPGLVMGGRMVSVALERIPAGILYDAVCETTNCLPDAVQLLTPCTVGNGWLRVLPLGRFALTLYDKGGGNGIRVFLDAKKLGSWEEISAWFLGTKPKSDQDRDRLLAEIRGAGERILSLEKIRVTPDFMDKQRLGKKSFCPACGECYPLNHGSVCRGCQGDAPYLFHMPLRD